ncbi:MAG: hypothetical protein ACE5DM_01630 [Candidatus Nanoarchaeia archaeon]
MQKLRILNSREKKGVLEKIKEQWGCKFETCLVMMLSSKDKIYLITRDMERLDLSKLKIDSMGTYFGMITNQGIRLSIEGSQMIGPIAKKNLMNVDHEAMRRWLKGHDLKLEEEHPGLNGFIILKYNKDFLGTGKIRDKEVLCYVPKNRRILADD